MSYNNYKEKVWAVGIETELARATVFKADCVTKYQGSINKRGDTVRIKGVGKPAIGEYSNDEQLVLTDPERVADTSVSITADKVFTFNYAVDDIDKAQGAGDVISALNTEASEQFANKVDTLIANLSLDKQAVKQAKTPVALTKDNILDQLDICLQMLYENDVVPSTTTTVTLPPWAYTLFRKAYMTLDTNNSEILKNGQVAKYGNAIIRMSNNVANDGTGDLIQVKTQRALALVSSDPHTEPYRIEKGFADAVKGFIICGGKIIRPKEMVNLYCKRA